MFIKRKAKKKPKKPPFKSSFFEKIFSSKIFQKTFLLAFVFLFIISIAYLIGNFFVENKIFAFEKCEYIGLEKIQKEQIDKIVNFKKNSSIFKFNLQEAKLKLEKLINIEKCSIYLKIPNTVIIKITEREAFAIVQIAKHKYLMDKKGYIYAKDKGKYELPLLTGIVFDQIDKKNKIADLVIKNFNQLIKLSKAKDLPIDYKTICEFSFDKDVGVDLKVDLGKKILPIHLGWGDFEEKYEQLKILGDYIRQKGLYKSHVFDEINSIYFKNPTQIIIDSKHDITPL